MKTFFIIRVGYQISCENGVLREYENIAIIYDRFVKTFFNAEAAVCGQGSVFIYFYNELGNRNNFFELFEINWHDLK